MGADGKMTRRQFAAAAGGAAWLAASGASGAGGAAAEGGLQAGAAETVVTPAGEGTFLVGPMKPSTGVHDDLYARVLVLAAGADRAALVTIDYCGFDLAYNDVLVGAVSKATGIPGGSVLINCSHNHGAPLTVPWGPWEKKKDKPFHRMLPVKLAAAAAEACGRLRPARIRCCREATQIGFNRRCPTPRGIVMAPNPNGAVIAWVDVLAVDGADGKPIAVLFSHAAHPVIVHATTTLISAGYPGFAARTLRTLRGGGICMFAQGCCGNVNAFPLKGGLGAAGAAGRDLAQAVARALAGEGIAIAGVPLAVRSCEPAIPLAGEDGATMRFPMRAVALGRQLCILGLAHEPFAEYHLWVEKALPFPRSMVLGYTNGVECYVGTEKDYLLGDRGGYETSPRGAAASYESRRPLAPRAEREIRKGILAVLGALRSAVGATSAG